MMFRRSHSRWTRVLLLACAGAALAACGGGGGGGSKSSTGVMKLGITDAPVDAADKVVIQFSGVELKPVNGTAIQVDFSSPKSFDLLTLQGTSRAMLLDGQTLPAGDYEWVRLKVNADPNVAGDSYVEVNGQQCEMRIPSGAETGLKLVSGFTIGVGTTTDFTVDFDLRKSVVRPPGQHAMTESCGGQAYMLKPAMRMVNNLQVGTLTGTVDPTLVSTKCTVNSTTSQVAPGNIYLFGPYTTTPPLPDDVDGVANDPNGADPLASAMVTTNSGGSYVYTIGYVPVGNYVVAYTCDSDQPDIDANDPASPAPPAVDEVVTFTPTAGTQVAITAGGTATVNFGP